AVRLLSFEPALVHDQATTPARKGGLGLERDDISRRNGSEDSRSEAGERLDEAVGDVVGDERRLVEPQEESSMRPSVRRGRGDQREPCEQSSQYRSDAHVSPPGRMDARGLSVLAVLTLDPDAPRAVSFAGHWQAGGTPVRRRQSR